MRTDTNGSSERSRFDLAQRVVLWYGLCEGRDGECRSDAKSGETRVNYSIW